jgi:hypothetical protein
LYVLQVEGGSLGHIDVCKSPKKVTFDDGKGIGLEGEIVESRANSHDHDDGFDHLVAHALACTLEDDVVCAKEYGSICFGSLDEVMTSDDDLMKYGRAYVKVAAVQRECSTSRVTWLDQEDPARPFQ